MHRFRIRTLLILFLLLQLGAVLSLAGIYLQWRMRFQMEGELGRKLVALASTAAQLAESAVGPAPIISLVPGDEASRTSSSLQHWLTPLLKAGGLAKLIVFDRNNCILFDSADRLGIGSEYVRLRFDEKEIAEAWSGKPVAATLFTDSDGQPFKAAYAPIFLEGRAVAILGLEGSAESLAAVAETRRALWTIAVISLVAATASGVVFARRLTSPLERLQRAAAGIAIGADEINLEVRGTEEIRFLAQTMQQMRNAIVRREQNLRMMLAGVAHEIRNPLGGIELFAGLLQKDAPAELQPQIQKIRTEVRRLENIVRDFLEYARPGESRKHCIPLLPLVNEICEQMNHMAREVRWDIQIGDDTQVEADPDQLRRMLINLIRNALEALQLKGEPLNGTVRIKTQSLPRSVAVSIIDNGPGVPADLADKIFEPFFTTRPQGSGLGLALVKRLAEQNNGSVELMQSQQPGAHFRLILPKSLGEVGLRHTDS